MFTVKAKYHTWEIDASGRTVLFLNGHVGCRAIWKSCRDSKDSTCLSNMMQLWSLQVAWLTGYQPRVLFTKSSAWKYLVYFCFQIKQGPDLSSGAMFVTLEFAVSSLAAAEWLRQQGQMFPSAVWQWVEQNKPQKWAGRCSTLLHLWRSLGKAAPSPHVHHKDRWAHFSTGLGEAMDAVRREESREKGQSWEQLFHTVPCAARHFQLGICAVVLAWENQPSALHLRSQHRGGTKGTGGSCRESSVPGEGESGTFLKWSLIWHSHLEKQI